MITKVTKDDERSLCFGHPYHAACNKRWVFLEPTFPSQWREIQENTSNVEKCSPRSGHYQHADLNLTTQPPRTQSRNKPAAQHTHLPDKNNSISAVENLNLRSKSTQNPGKPAANSLQLGATDHTAIHCEKLQNPVSLPIDLLLFVVFLYATAVATPREAKENPRHTSTNPNPKPNARRGSFLQQIPRSTKLFF